MEEEIIYCDECDREAIYKWDGIFVSCLTKTLKKEVKKWILNNIWWLRSRSRR